MMMGRDGVGVGARWRVDRAAEAMLRNEEHATVSFKRLICHTEDPGRLNSSKETLTANGPRRSPPEDCDGSTGPSRPAGLNDTVLLFMLLFRVSKQGGLASLYADRLELTRYPSRFQGRCRRKRNVTPSPHRDKG